MVHALRAELIAKLSALFCCLENTSESISSYSQYKTTFIILSCILQIKSVHLRDGKDFSKSVIHVIKARTQKLKLSLQVLMSIHYITSLLLFKMSFIQRQKNRSLLKEYLASYDFGNAFGWGQGGTIIHLNTVLLSW